MAYTNASGCVMIFSTPKCYFLTILGKHLTAAGVLRKKYLVFPTYALTREKCFGIHILGPSLN